MMPGEMQSELGNESIHSGEPLLNRESIHSGEPLLNRQSIHSGEPLLNRESPTPPGAGWVVAGIGHRGGHCLPGIIS